MVDLLIYRTLTIRPCFWAQLKLLVALYALAVCFSALPVPAFAIVDGYSVGGPTETGIVKIGAYDVGLAPGFERLSGEYDECGEINLYLATSVGGPVLVQRGSRSGVQPVSSNQITWWCGGRPAAPGVPILGIAERTVCPTGTTHVEVVRYPTGRRLFTHCYKFDPGVTAHQPEGACSGTIVASLQSRNETWVLTAAHCFYHNFHDRLFLDVERADVFIEPRAAIYFDGGLLKSNWAQSEVFIHPDWAAGPNWFDKPDIALIKIATAIAVPGKPADYQRPIFVGSRSDLELMLANSSVREQWCWKHAANSRTSCVNLRLGATPATLPPEEWHRVGRPGSVCGYQETNSLTCGDVVRFGTANDGYVYVRSRDWVDGANFTYGDSGGPYLVHSGFGGMNVPHDGVVIGVVSGPAVGESFALNLASCPCDWYGMGTFALGQWLSDVAGSDSLHFVSQLAHPISSAKTVDERLEPLSREKDNCGAESLRFRMAYGNVYLSKGMRSGIQRVTGPAVDWQCARTNERTVCPLNTTHAEVTRTLPGRRLFTSCYTKRTGPYAMVRPLFSSNFPDTTDLLLASEERDNCGRADFLVETQGGNISVPTGASSGIWPAASSTIRWWCGGTHESTTCPGETTHIDVYREGDQRRLYTRCYYRLAFLFSGPQFSQLARERDNCANNNFRVVSDEGDVYVAKGQTSPVKPVGSTEIIWYCGNSREQTVCPRETSHIKVEREASGRRFYTYCYRQNY